MRFLLDKIKKLQIGWNERPLTEADFYLLCTRFNIQIVETPQHTSGFHFRLLGRDIIAVDSKLSGDAKLAVLFHELGHFLFHVPESGPAANFHNVGKKTRQEIEADVFAICALIPCKKIAGRSIQELVEVDSFPFDMATARLDIYRRYGI